MQVGQEQMGTSRELLTLTLGNEEYGINVLKVQEICGCEAETTIVNAEFIKGVINLRKIVAPVVDRRIKFRLGSVTYDETTVAIISTSSAAAGISAQLNLQYKLWANYRGKP